MAKLPGRSIPRTPRSSPDSKALLRRARSPTGTPELAEIERQIKNLFEHPVFKRMMEVPERILEVEILRSVPIEGVPVWVKLDALMQGNDGGVVIVDWKTGRDHDDASIAQQLGIYGIYAVQLRGVPVEKVQALHVNLRYNTHTAHPINARVCGPEPRLRCALRRGDARRAQRPRAQRRPGVGLPDVA
ncbi:MAG: PD-(D/E)XK nuclease family protein [Deltaproteobacteria bacterium]|nr:PD-(D/E)XK nuclease family protein [Deltaproteobacteria bacterium]